jgi:hypothetical protein
LLLKGAVWKITISFCPSNFLAIRTVSVILSYDAKSLPFDHT